MLLGRARAAWMISGRTRCAETRARRHARTLREGALERYGDLQVHTGSKLIPQWESKCFSQIMPFVIPRMVSGPDYTPAKRWRRKYDDAPYVGVQSFCAAFARRVEGCCRTNWSALPIVRSVAYKHTAEHTMTSLAPFYGKRLCPTNTSAGECI